MSATVDAGVAFGGAFGAVLVAELGDRTQVALLVASSQVNRPWALFGAAMVAFAVSGALAVGVGASLGLMVPERWLRVGSGALFLAFGLAMAWAAWRGRGGEGEPEMRLGGERGLVIAAAVAIFLAELGDKTQLTTGLLAATGPWAAVFAGATLALFVNAAVAVALGRQLRRLPERFRLWVQPIAAVVFLTFGVLYLVGGLSEPSP